MLRIMRWASAALVVVAVAGRASGADGELRVGMIGLDTSHAPAFAKFINGPKPKGHPLEGMKVVAAFPGGSPDVASSRDRVEGFTKQLRDMKIEIVGSVEELLPKVDVVLLESVDGRKHLEQAEPVLKAKKPVFIDKPFAGTLADAVKIFDLAEKYDTPCFSTSSLRYNPTLVALKKDPKVGEIVGAFAYSPSPLEEHHPDLFWYGIHGVESLYAVMGTGCVSVTRSNTEGADVVTGIWSDNRVGSFRGIRKGKADYGVVAFGTKGVGRAEGSGGYEPMLIEIGKFFRTGKPPVSAKETLELFAFMEAADESKRLGGAPVTIASVIEKAKAKAGK